MEVRTEDVAVEEVQQDVQQTAVKAFSKLGLMFLVGTAVIYAAQTLVGMLVKQLNPAWLENTTINLILSVLPMYLVGMPIMIALVKKIPGQAPKQRKMKPWQFIVAVAMTFSIMYISNLVGLALTGIAGAIKGEPIDNMIMDIATNANMVVTFIYMVICAPILEEYVFRKLIVDRTARYGQGVAIIVSGLMFGLFHGNLSQFVYATTLGMFFAFLYVKTGNLKITIGLHMIINFMGAVASTLVLKAIKYEELLAVSASGAEAELMAFVMENLGGFLVYMVYICMVLAVVLAGIVLFIVFRKRFKLEAGEVSIPKGQRFKTVFVNFGMGLFSLFWIAMIILQLVQ